MQDFKDILASLRSEFNTTQINANKEIDEYGNEYFYTTKEKFANLMTNIDEQKSANLMLQRQITTLKKEKTDLSLAIKACNDAVDKIEMELGINLELKRKQDEEAKRNSML